MREIKFRAWDGKEMLRMPINTRYGLGRFFGFIGESDDLMQYTGLKDKNGVEIYEGDVAIRTINYGKTIEKGAIVFDSKGAYFGFRRYRPNGSTMITSIGIDAPKLEVIGNIYQNSELLNG